MMMRGKVKEMKAVERSMQCDDEMKAVERSREGQGYGREREQGEDSAGTSMSARPSWSDTVCMKAGMNAPLPVLITTWWAEGQ